MVTTPQSIPAAPGKLDYYWALAEPEIAVKHIVNRRDAFYHYLRSTAYFEKIIRNWEYYHSHFYPARGASGMAILRGGEKGELSKIACNHFRSFIHLLLTYVIQNRPAFDTRAINSDHRSLLQAELGNQILDYYMEEKKLEDVMRRAVENALIFSVGYIKCTWDYNRGQEMGAYPQQPGQDQAPDIVYEGDFLFETPSIFDVAYDHTYQRFDDSPWSCCRRSRNKWEVINEAPPEKRQKILDSAIGQSGAPYEFEFMLTTGEESDIVSEWHFYHDRTPAFPLGRYMVFVGADTVLYDGPLPDAYKNKPLYRITASDYLLTTFGWTPGFDLQGPQEALNMNSSTIVTNQNNLGPTKIWFQEQETINRAELEPGITVIQSATKPEPLNLLATPPELFKARDMWLQDMEYISGINSVARGQPEASLKSGAALALIDSKAVQFSSLLQQAYYGLLSEIGGAILYGLKSNVWNQRFIAVAGENMRSHLKAFGPGDLDMIDRVVVQSANPLMRTTAGRKEIASELLQNGLIQTPEEYLTVIKTGQTKPLTESVDAQLMKVHAENESLRNAQPHAAMVTDNHALHIKKHAGILDSPDMYGNPAVAQPVLAAVMEHVQMLQNPAVQMLMLALGFPVPLPAMAPPPAPGQKGPPNNGQQNQPPQPKQAKGPPGTQVPGAPPVPGYPAGGDQSLGKGMAA